MSTDRELLELAAKAAGLEIKTKFYEIGGWHAWWHHVISEGNEEWINWNPLTDDGDAQRLAVKLGLTVRVVNGLAGWTCVDVLVKDSRREARESHNGDPDAATRRAIVRAAAAIGGAL